MLIPIKIKNTYQNFYVGEQMRLYHGDDDIAIAATLTGEPVGFVKMNPLKNQRLIQILSEGSVAVVVFAIFKEQILVEARPVFVSNS